MDQSPPRQVSACAQDQGGAAEDPDGGESTLQQTLAPLTRLGHLTACLSLQLPSVSQETLKHSGIGRAVMFLYKHPKESRSNKDLALKLISKKPCRSQPACCCWLRHISCISLCVRLLPDEWSRPIFGLTSNYKGMTREERQQRDLDQQMPQRRRLRYRSRSVRGKRFSHDALSLSSLSRPLCCSLDLLNTDVTALSHHMTLKFCLPFESLPPSQPQKVERAEEPDVFSPPSRFSVGTA